MRKFECWIDNFAYTFFHSGMCLFQALGLRCILQNHKIIVSVNIVFQFTGSFKQKSIKVFFYKRKSLDLNLDKMTDVWSKFETLNTKGWSPKQCYVMSRFDLRVGLFWNFSKILLSMQNMGIKKRLEKNESV